MASGADLLEHDRRPPVTPSGRRQLTVADLSRMMDEGIIQEGERTELVGGELFVMPSEGGLHDSAVELLTRLFEAALGGEVRVRQSGPLNLPPDTQLSPDLSVWPMWVWGDDKTGANVLLVVEVCRTTQHNDFVVKSERYAAGGVPEYWIFEPAQRRLTVRRTPVEGKWTVDAPWTEPTISPLFAPGVIIEWLRACDPPRS